MKEQTKQYALALTRLIYVVGTVMTIGYLVYDRQPKQEPKVEVVSPPAVAPKDFEELKLEQQRQEQELKRLAKQIEEQAAMDKKIERKQDNNLQVMKRICEYIWVITIDKKIAPRQCYPEYNWSKE
ncbi:MAG: hypothetical protein EBW11_13250 [Betaproteobacteria bacterium]|nr:hypothetical protein [Betaproteobacteria bacterium]